jgi:hypothetical protein
MSCPQANTHTLLWLYGEGEPSHDAHIASCDHCQAVVATHEAVQFCVSESQGVTVTQERPANTSLKRWVLGAGFLLAAGALAWVAVTPAPQSPVAETRVYWDFDGFSFEGEMGFDGLEDELALLEEDLLAF